jgi:hypothetical protein
MGAKDPLSRHVRQRDGASYGTSVRRLADALAARDISAAVEHASALIEAIGSPNGDANAVAGIEHLVRAVAQNRRELLPLRAIAPELTRAVKNPWRTREVKVKPGVAIGELPPTELRSVRLDPTLTTTITTDGNLGQPRLNDGSLVFTHARRLTARVEGPLDRLGLLLDVVEGRRLKPNDLLAFMLPARLDEFSRHTARRQLQVDQLLAEGRRMVDAVERMVCRLYGVPDELTELVIESADARAGAIGPDGGRDQ